MGVHPLRHVHFYFKNNNLFRLHFDGYHPIRPFSESPASARISQVVLAYAYPQSLAVACRLKSRRLLKPPEWIRLMTTSTRSWTIETKKTVSRCDGVS
jgi:hypothetical protein